MVFLSIFTVKRTIFSRNHRILALSNVAFQDVQRKVFDDSSIAFYDRSIYVLERNGYRIKRTLNDARETLKGEVRKSGDGRSRKKTLYLE